MRDADSLYHRLFAHPRMVEGLVREFVPRAWIAGGLFAELVREIIAGRGVRLSGSEGLSEMKTRISVDWDAGKEQWVAKGKAEGKAEGIAVGKAQGKAEALVCLLAERFGAVAPSWQKRIRGAKLATLERWFKRAIVASDLRSVFHPPR
jgi:hypothetical protein